MSKLRPRDRKDLPKATRVSPAEPGLEARVSRAIARHLPSSLEPQAVMLPHLSLTGKSPWEVGPAGEDVLNSK